MAKSIRISPTSSERHVVLLRQIAGHLAMWAVRLSPYPAPSGLAEVVARFQEGAAPRFKLVSGLDMAELSRAELRSLLADHLLSQPEVQGWNERRNRRDGHGFITATSARPDPDDDFVDLEALVQNIVFSVFHESNAVPERATASAP